MYLTLPYLTLPYHPVIYFHLIQFSWSLLSIDLTIDRYTNCDEVCSCVVVEAVKLILMILCSSQIISRRNWTNSGTEWVIFTSKNRLTEMERFVLCLVSFIFGQILAGRKFQITNIIENILSFHFSRLFFSPAKFSIVIRHSEAEAVWC